jgi:hypothetical protein
MGQFDSYIEHNAPWSPRTTRVVNLVIPTAAIVNAAVDRDFSSILLAALFALVLLPAGIAPTAHRAALAALDRHAVTSAGFMFLITSLMLFALFARLVSRSTSLYTAVPAAAALAIYGAIRRRARLRAGAEPS